MAQWKEAFYNFCHYVVYLLSAIFMIFLTYNTFRYTEYMTREGGEKHIIMQDSVLGNSIVVFGFLLLMLALCWIGGKIPPVGRRVLSYLAILLTLLWAALASAWWIRSIERFPINDQEFLLAGTIQLKNGVYNCLQKGDYFQKYPFQLGMATVLGLFLTIFGESNFQSWMWINCASVLVTIWCGYRCLRIKEVDFPIEIAYCVAMALCLPLIFYTTWLYGDLPGTAFAAWALLEMVKYEKKRRTIHLTGMALSAGASVFFRMNMVILPVALVILGLLHILRNGKKGVKFLAFSILALILPFAVLSGIHAYFEKVSGQEHMGGVPVSRWIATGTYVNNLDMPGWYRWEYDILYHEWGCDNEKANEQYKEILMKNLDAFAEDPSYAISFYKDKMLSQWNAPLFESLYFSQENEPLSYGVPYYLEDSLLGRLYDPEGTEKAAVYMNYLQCVIYLGFLLFVLWGFRGGWKNSDVMFPVLCGILFLGGFFFSALWEAKARYCLAYYITMFLPAVFGWHHLMELANTGIGKLSSQRKRKKVDGKNPQK